MPVPTGGAWPGVVGASGYILLDYNGGSFGACPSTNDVSSLPAGCAVTAPTGSFETFLFGTTTEPTGTKWLENAVATSASGGAWFCTSSSTIKFTWSGGHSFTGTISAYMCDYDAGGRVQTITDGTTLSNVSGTPFQNGQWVQWSETIPANGSITFTLAPNGGNGQAVISGFFFDAAGGGTTSIPSLTMAPMAAS